MWDFKGTSADQYPLGLHFPYFDRYWKLVVNQADLVLAVQLGQTHSPASRKPEFAYCEWLTVADS